MIHELIHTKSLAESIYRKIKGTKAQLTQHKVTNTRRKHDTQFMQDA